MHYFESRPFSLPLALLSATRAFVAWAKGVGFFIKAQVLHNRPNEGPPDLDALWRDFNRKLSQIFSGNNGGSNSNNGNESLKPEGNGAGIGAGVLVGLVLLVWLGSGVYIVQEGQQAVVTTFGRFSHTADSGLGLRGPYPFQSHEIVNLTQLRSIDVGSAVIEPGTGLRDSSMLTRDENIIDIQFTVQYRLDDAKLYLYENRNTDQAVQQAAESAVREVVGNSTMDSVLYEQRDAIASRMRDSIQAQVKRIKAGVTIANVNIKSVQAPEQVQAAFDDAFKAGLDRERFKNESQAYANDVIPKAQGTASRLREEASGYASRVVSQAEGDAQRFKLVLAEYQKAPGVTRDRLYLDTMQQVYSNVTKVLVDSRQGSNLLYLPLDKLMSMSTNGGSGAAAGSGVMSSPPNVQGPADPPATASLNATSPAAVDSRSRDGLRSRDRELR